MAEELAEYGARPFHPNQHIYGFGYQLVPYGYNVESDSPSVAYYVAYNMERGSLDWAISPDKGVDTFYRLHTNENPYGGNENWASNFALHMNNVSPYVLETQKSLYYFNELRFGKSGRAFVGSYGEAVQDPGWWLGTLASVLGGVVARGGGVANTGANSSINGVRLRMQLSAEQAAGARMPTQISGYSDHAVKQIAGRDGGIGVKQSAINDAWSNPIKIEYVPTQFGPSFRLTGKNAVVAVNVDGKVTTTWATSSAGVAK